MMKERRDGRSGRKLRHRSAIRSGAGWWLIVRNGADRIEMLTVGGSMYWRVGLLKELLPCGHWPLGSLLALGFEVQADLF